MFPQRCLIQRLTHIFASSKLYKIFTIGVNLTINDVLRVKVGGCDLHFWIRYAFHEYFVARICPGDTASILRICRYFYVAFPDPHYPDSFSLSSSPRSRYA
ncbi:hypothetical protein Y032_0030g2171 [Ancylostoma ceylanicum]|uniref:Uncharacterized protein n=1 Tax=Ancylostoma ceylanicum TaxID=53326 RepID=A0A016US36_9BILA|nr:hypothetical protein Y032_0030g2171 [Ancylostoma ceylanicum]